MRRSLFSPGLSIFTQVIVHSSHLQSLLRLSLPISVEFSLLFSQAKVNTVVASCSGNSVSFSLRPRALMPSTVRNIYPRFICVIVSDHVYMCHISGSGFKSLDKHYEYNEGIYRACVPSPTCVLQVVVPDAAWRPAYTIHSRHASATLYSTPLSVFSTHINAYRCQMRAAPSPR